MVHPKSVKRKGEWTRVKDKPYGKEKYTGPDIDRFFTDDWIEVNVLDPKNFDLLHTVYNAQPVWKGFLSDLPQELLSESIERNYRYEDGVFAQDNSEFHIKIFGKNEFLFAPEQLNLINPKYLIEVETHRDFIKHHAGSRNFFAPYPFCEKYWAYAEIDPKLIQPDWRQGMIDVMQASLDYYNNTPYGHENMAYNQHARDYSEKISEYCQNGKTVKNMLNDYLLTLEDVPEFADIKFSKRRFPVCKSFFQMTDKEKMNSMKPKPEFEELDKYGDALCRGSYERARKMRIGLLEEALITLRAIK